MRDSNAKEKMREGLISLMMRKSLIDITVTDLVKESNVARASFYRTYDNIDQILDDLVIFIIDNFKERYLPYLLSKDIEKIKYLTADYYRAVKEKNSKTLIILPENLALLVYKIEHEDFEYAGLVSKYLPCLVIVNVANISRIWAKNGYTETPEELADFTFDIIGKAFLS